MTDRFTQKRVEELELKIRELLAYASEREKERDQQEHMKWAANRRADKAEAELAAVRGVSL